MILTSCFSIASIILAQNALQNTVLNVFIMFHVCLIELNCFQRAIYRWKNCNFGFHYKNQSIKTHLYRMLLHCLKICSYVGFDHFCRKNNYAIILLSMILCSKQILDGNLSAKLEKIMSLRIRPIYISMIA